MSTLIQLLTSSSPDTGGLMKSGLVNSTALNDDAMLQPGDNPSYLRTNFNNPFGNDYLLTGVNGGYQDLAGNYFLADGSAAANRAAAFPDEIIINWDTWRPQTNTVWGLNINGVGSFNPAGAAGNLGIPFTAALTFSLGSYTTGWMAASLKFWQQFPILSDVQQTLNYPPLNRVGAVLADQFWTSTRRQNQYYVFAYFSGNATNFSIANTGERIVPVMRKFTYNPLTNTLN